MAERNRHLDGLRGIAILLVVLQHIVTSRVTVQSLSFRWVLERLSDLGQTGVDLFFVLSGFLLTGILLDHGREPGALKTFYIRRACRILPLYFAFISAMFALLWMKNRFHWKLPLTDTIPLWSCLTFTQNFVLALQGHWSNPPLLPTWSLAVEEQFYFLLPMTVLWTTRRGLAVAALAVLAAGVGFRWWWTGMAATVLLPWRADGLMIGVLAALLVRDPGAFEFFRKNRDVAAGAALVLAVGWIGSGLVRDLLGPFRLTWISVLFGLLLLLTVTLEGDSPASRFLAARPLVWVGTISYGVYLLHNAVLQFTFHLVFGRGPTVKSFPDVLLTLAAIAVTLVLADLSFRFFERPLISVGHRFGYGAASPTRA